MTGTERDAVVAGVVERVGDVFGIEDRAEERAGRALAAGRVRGVDADEAAEEVDGFVGIGIPVDGGRSRGHGDLGGEMCGERSAWRSGRATTPLNPRRR